MLVNLSDELSKKPFDYCIIGTGPAGVTVARKLASTGKSILLLEGGDEVYSQSSQDFYKGVVIGDTYHRLDHVRLRQFGGTSVHWGGWCRTLDTEDFEGKSAAPQTRWPLSKLDLDIYLKEASDILDIPEIPPNVLFGSSGLRLIQFALTDPEKWGAKGVNFAQKYKEEILRSRNIFLAFNSNVQHLNSNENTVRSVTVATNDGRSITIPARHFILAAGGIENSRLLLWSNEINNGETVKNNSSLGRYWMEHLRYGLGDALIFGSHTLAKQTEGYTFFSPTRETMQSNLSLNCGLGLVHDLQREGVKKMIGDLACVSPDLGKRVARLFDKNLVCGVRVFAAWEQEPVATNKIALSKTDVDRLNVPRVELHWKKNQTDFHTAKSTAETLGNYLAEQNIGRLRLFDWMSTTQIYPENDYISNYHLMGGTRMSDDPQYGVVDKDCKVFGQNNLWLAGSSVFPSGGHTGPTLTIVQLALRLVEHLKRMA